LGYIPYKVLLLHDVQFYSLKLLLRFSFQISNYILSYPAKYTSERTAKNDKNNEYHVTLRGFS